MCKILDTSLDKRCKAYTRIAIALEFLGENWHQPFSLNELAHHVGLSPSYFQREFSQWVGLSPKQYQSAIIHGQAGHLLQDGFNLEDTAFEVGLSGTSRLHDLFIAHEALSPGEIKRAGQDVDLIIGRGPTPFGEGVYLISARGLCGLGFIDGDSPETEKDAFHDLAGRYPNASIRRDDKIATDWSNRVFVHNVPTPLALYGTPFRRQVWRALLDIPLGNTCSYGQLAAAIGREKAARATGAAIGANPISFLIPCHRALSKTGKLHNYHWGLKRKRTMLAYEKLWVESQKSRL